MDAAVSAAEYQQGEQHSSVKISQNAKGEAQVEVKAYTHDLAFLEAARMNAVGIYKKTVAEVRP
jgi:hypothetical protein